MANYAKQGPNTGYYGADGGIMPVFSCGAQALAPSLLTGDGSHMSFWVAIVIHVTALTLNLAANVVFFSADHSSGADLLWTWALFSLIAHTVAVLGTLTYTGFIRNALGMPNVLMFGFGLFFGAIVATGKISYAHSGMAADAAENVLYNLSIVFQVFGMSSVLVNAIVASSKSGGL
jgi:hypothetical protein